MDTSKLKAGDPHYRAYVGPPGQYDFMGATQFRLLCTLGLRERHTLLDFGCGSLRAGRLLIPYLDRGHYHGIEPNRWLIEEAIEQQLGADSVRLKQPRFSYDDGFDATVFGRSFDFIVAQSVFSHADRAMIVRALAGFAAALQPDGLVVATFIEGSEDFAGAGWVYPGCVRYRPDTVIALAGGAGLHAQRLPWFHPRQTWYLMARSARRLVPPEHLTHLSGAVLFDPEFHAGLASRGG